MAFCGQARPFFAVNLFDLEIPVVKGVGQVSRCPLTLTAGDWSVVQEDNRSACLCQQVSGRKARDSRADNAHVRDVEIRCTWSA